MYQNRNILDQVAFLSSSNENFSLVLADKLTSNDKDSMLDLTLKDGLVYQNIFSEDSSFIYEFGEFNFPLKKDKEQSDIQTLSKVFDYSEKSRFPLFVCAKFAHESSFFSRI